MADESDNPPFPVGRASNIAIQAAWAQQQSDAAASWSSGMPLPLRVQAALRVRPETSGRIAEFSEHEAD